MNCKKRTLRGLAASLFVLMALVLAGFGPAQAKNVVVFDDSNYVDTNNILESESDNIQASITSLGHTVTTFTGVDGTSWANALAGKDVLVIPEMEEDELNPDLSSGARTQLRNFVQSGRTLIISSTADGSDSPVAGLLNESFGFNVSEEYVSDEEDGEFSTRTGAAASTQFASAPTTLAHRNATGGLETSSLPTGARSIYQFFAYSTDYSTVAQLPYGSGNIVFLGWDWYREVPPIAGDNDNGWRDVLGLAINVVGTPPEEVSGIVIERGLFIAAEPLPGNFGLRKQVQFLTLKNKSGAAITGPVYLVLDNLSRATLTNRSGTTLNAPFGSSYIQVNVGNDNVFSVNEKVTVQLNLTPTSFGTITYNTRVLAGNGTP